MPDRLSWAETPLKVRYHFVQALYRRRSARQKVLYTLEINDNVIIIPLNFLFVKKMTENRLQIFPAPASTPNLLNSKPLTLVVS